MKELKAKIEQKIIDCKNDLGTAITACNYKLSEQLLGEIRAYEDVLKMIPEE